ncbi:MAG TPA: ATP synthase subunit I [Steroidobacteraceae bacterium]|nr:ATP synthase subunit I [Steroidobacteraceae bacterium]
MIALDLPHARRLAFMCVRAQVLVTLLVALMSLVVAGAHAAWSAVVGGGASTVGSVAMALLAFGRLSGAGAERMLLAFYVGELAKITAVIAALVLALVFMKVNPVAMIAAFMATFLVYWVVLARALWSGRTAPLPDAKGSVGDAPHEMG